jgi:hypothetical protein
MADLRAPHPRLVERATTDEIVEAAEVERISRSKLRAARLTDGERARVEARMRELGEQRAARRAQHQAKLEREGHRLGRKVRAYRMTLTDADRRLDGLVHALDPEMPVALVPFREGAAIAAAAFAAAFEAEVA